MKDDLAEFAATTYVKGHNSCKLRHVIGDELLHVINAHPEIRSALVKAWLQDKHGIAVEANSLSNHRRHATTTECGQV